MCGIVGFLQRKPVQKRLLDGLKTLEYRGYDSAGIAVIQNNQIVNKRAVGKLFNLTDLLEKEPVTACAGIGHTRWATHGVASLENAHPHVSREVVVVHNGIIENFAAVKDYLQEQGFVFNSQTDTEVICHLIQHEYDKYQEKSSDSRAKSVQQACKQLHGSFALAICFSDAPYEMYGACLNSPLCFGMLHEQHVNKSSQNNEFFIASDPLAFASLAKFITYLQSGQILQIVQSHLDDIYRIHSFTDSSCEQLQLEPNRLAEFCATKNEYPHFMLKEIHEQPKALFDTYQHVISLLNAKKELIHQIFHQNKGSSQNKSISDKITLIACGTSYHACCIARYYFERHAKIQCCCELASEFLYREPIIDGAYCFVSQSGETRDTVAAHDLVKNSPSKPMTIAIVNVSTSQLARKADLVLTTQAGPEIGVASTKAFTCQIMVFIGLVTQLMADEARMHEIRSSVVKAALDLDQYLKLHQHEILDIAQQLARYKSVTYLGRNVTYPLALEGALKLKELCYIHAEGYAAGELKHGPIALIDSQMPVITIVNQDNFEKIMSNVQEVLARNGLCIVILSTDLKAKFIKTHDSRASSRITSPAPNQKSVSLQFITIPDAGHVADIFAQAAVLQLLAYYCACDMGVDVDQPRNLAKCVTVE